MTIENICLNILYDGQGNIWHGLFKEETYFVVAKNMGIALHRDGMKSAFICSIEIQN